MSKSPWGITSLDQAALALEAIVEIDPAEAARFIETNGLRYAWSRAAACPCKPVDPQLTRCPVDCTRCAGDQYLYFGPDAYSIPLDAGRLTDVQLAIIGADPQGRKRSASAVIRGLTQDMERNEDSVDKLGHWAFGSVSVTVRPENPLGYLDRLVLLDGLISYTEVVVQPAAPGGWRDTRPEPATVLPLRYRAESVNLLQSEERDYYEEADFDLVVGRVVWRPGRAPEAGTRLSAHFQCHPAYLVMNTPHVTRTGNVRLREPDPSTPAGNATELPVRAFAQLAHLVDRTLPQV